jgi:hypothetical protein
MICQECHRPINNPDDTGWMCAKCAGLPADYDDLPVINSRWLARLEEKERRAQKIDRKLQARRICPQCFSLTHKWEAAHQQADSSVCDDCYTANLPQWWFE